MNELIQYLRAFLKSMSNAFSIGSLILIILTFLVPEIDKYQDKIVAILLIITFFAAGFYAWRGDRKSSKIKPTLELSVSKPDFQPRTFHGPALGKANISFDIDLCNISSEMCWVERPVLEDFKIDGALFKSDNPKYQIRLKGQGHERPSFPFKILSNDRNIFSIQVEMESILQEPKVQAYEIRKMHQYSFTLKLDYRFISTGGKMEEHITGNFESLIQAITDHWKNNKQFEFLYIYNTDDK